MGSARAARNAGPLETTLLSTIRTKLGLLSAQHTCPMCYERFTDADGAKPATTLSCAHKVCTECWSEWRKMQGAHAFCPLCRLNEFLHAMLPGVCTRASGTCFARCSYRARLACSG